MAAVLESVADRRDYFEISDEDLARARSLRPFFERHIDAILDRLYAFLVAHPQTKAFLRDAATIERVRRAQRAFFLGLLSGSFDAGYLEGRRKVGEAAERIGLPPTLYVGAYAVFMRELQDHLHAQFDPIEANLNFNSFRKLVFLDQALTIETYTAAAQRTIEHQQAAIRELSTPVIQVHDRVLLLPLVGAIDEARAEQVASALLRGVAATRARVVIMDVAGVPSVDTHLARHLIETANAARLLGASAILSGISSSAAAAIVRLGVDTDGLATVGDLATAIARALAVVGFTIEARRPGQDRSTRR